MSSGHPRRQRRPQQVRRAAAQRRRAGPAGRPPGRRRAGVGSRRGRPHIRGSRRATAAAAPGLRTADRGSPALTTPAVDMR